MTDVIIPTRDPVINNGSERRIHVLFVKIEDCSMILNIYSKCQNSPNVSYPI